MARYTPLPFPYMAYQNGGVFMTDGDSAEVESNDDVRPLVIVYQGPLSGEACVIVKKFSCPDDTVIRLVGFFRQGHKDDWADARIVFKRQDGCTVADWKI